MERIKGVGVGGTIAEKFIGQMIDISSSFVYVL